MPPVSSRRAAIWRRAVPLLAWLSLLGVVASGCYAGPAARHTGRMLRHGLDVEERGPDLLWTAPTSLAAAPFNFLLRSVVPFDDSRPQPPEQWFRFYTGPMLPLPDVAVLCHEDRSTLVYTIRPSGGDGPAQPARYEKWHFPFCIEALPGLYELEVHYFLRRTGDGRDNTTTSHLESVEPSRVAWFAEPGGSYALRAIVGSLGASSRATPRSRVSRRSALGTSRVELEEGEWAAEIERIPSWDEFPEPVLEWRSAWARYERGF